MLAEIVSEQETGSVDMYRKMWGRFATGVTVITTVETNGDVHGMTANSLTSVSLVPPLVLVCVSHDRNTFELINRTGRFGISVLEISQKSIADFFSRPPEDRVGDVPSEYVELPGGWPVISGAISQIGCEVVARHLAGDHTIFVAEVHSFVTRSGDPLIWYQGQFGYFVEGNE